MESVGINTGYLLLQIAVCGLPALLVGGLVFFFVRRRQSPNKF